MEVDFILCLSVTFSNDFFFLMLRGLVVIQLCLLFLMLFSSDFIFFV